tara:strand:- start:1442 stop:2410 length:969 start_codon:yes stop_codon:yes gene_type:complete
MSTFKDKPLKKCHTDNRKMIDDIHMEIIKGMNEMELCEYYLENGLLLDEYYTNNDDTQKSSKGILTFFKGDEKEDETKTNRKEILNKYLSNVDEYVLNEKYIEKKMEKCENCNTKLMYDEIEGYLTCMKCGHTEVIIIVNEKGSYSDQPREANYFAYKRINHFNEWLAQFQAKGTSELPDTIYRDIYLELEKDINNRSLTSINPLMIRNTLKRLNYNKYYEHIPHLINVLSGNDPPTLSRKSEELLRSLFKEIQVPFMNNCPKNRKNFLSYSYVLHKFCELLEFNHLLPFFPFLKSREKLIQQDIIWEKICGDLKWEYVPST